MMKKINQDSIAIKELLQNGMRQCQICRILKLKLAKINYWTKTEIKHSQSKKKNLIIFIWNELKDRQIIKLQIQEVRELLAVQLIQYWKKRNVKTKKESK